MPLNTRFELQPTQALHTQIREHVRGLIVSGALKESDRLPSSQALAAHFNANVATVQNALAPLVKEGLLERTPRVGTFVRRPAPKLTRVGILLPGDVWMDTVHAFSRAVCAAAGEVLQAHGVALEPWTDVRAGISRRTPLPALVEACRERRIQGVIAPCVGHDNIPWIAKLPVPSAVVFGEPLRNGVMMDYEAFARDAVRHLAEEGCRSVGVIAATRPAAADGQPLSNQYSRFHLAFQEAVRAHKLQFRPEWLCVPQAERLVYERYEAFGYASMRTIWNCKTRPDGVVVYTDFVARGVLMALMELNVRVPQDIRLVLHRNAEFPFFCPFAATFMSLSCHAVAEALRSILIAGQQGEFIGPVRVPFQVITPNTQENKRCKAKLTHS